MAGNHVCFPGQVQKPLLDGLHEFIVIAAIQVCTANAAGKERVPAEKETVLSRIIAHAPARVSGRVNHLPGGAGRGNDIAIGNIHRIKIVLEEGKRRRGVRTAGYIVHGVHIQRMQVHRHMVHGQEFGDAPEMVKVPVREQDGVRREPMVLEKTLQLLHALRRGHARIHHRAGLLAIFPQHYAIGSQRVKGKY